ncbi:Late Embryogenesis Abundant protein, partial [Polypedilum vanderplanki]
KSCLKDIRKDKVVKVPLKLFIMDNRSKFEQSRDAAKEGTKEKLDAAADKMSAVKDATKEKYDAAKDKIAGVKDGAKEKLKNSLD